MRGIGRARDADLARRRGAAATVQPAIRPPAQAVGEGVIVLPRDREPIENDFGRTIGNIVAVAVGNEQELRRAKQPDAAKTQFDAAEALNVVGEDGPSVRAAVGVGVFEDQHAVAEPEVENLRTVGVRVVLGDPEAPASIPGHRNRVPHVGLGGEDIDVKPFRNAETSRGRRRGKGVRGYGAGIGWVREISGERGPIQRGDKGGSKVRRRAVGTWPLSSP